MVIAVKLSEMSRRDAAAEESVWGRLPSVLQ
jgi:hypothetical protein